MGIPSPPRIDAIRQRLLNHAKQAGEEFHLTLDRYAVGRLLYRLSISRHRDDFLLKGAMLFRHWFDQEHRPTRDADFLGFGSPDPARVEAIIRELCAIEVDDGLVFDLSDIGVTEIRETARYDGAAHWNAADRPIAGGGTDHPYLIERLSSRQSCKSSADLVRSQVLHFRFESVLPTLAS